MTIIEVAKLLNPQMGIGKVQSGCPYVHGYDSRERCIAFCGRHSCVECYSREFNASTASEEVLSLLCSIVDGDGDPQQFFPPSIDEVNEFIGGAE